MHPQRTPIINYESPELEGDFLFLKQMMQWRSRCGWCFAISLLLTGLELFATSLGTVIAALGVIAWMISVTAVGVCALLTILYLGKTAAAEVNMGYAARQVLLAALLTPLCLMGIFVLPILVQSDLMKWRRVEERNK